MAVHDFKERLAYSQQAGQEPFWDAVYRQAFPNMVNHMPLPGDTAGQRLGHDRMIYLANGDHLLLDEKKREKNWSDFALEYVSNDKTQAPGWMDKELGIDYLAYAFMPSQQVYLLPWQLLRRAWLTHREWWMKKYSTIPARNPGYTTLSKAVPIPVVLNAIGRVSLIELDRAAVDKELAHLQRANWKSGNPVSVSCDTCERLVGLLWDEKPDWLRKSCGHGFIAAKDAWIANNGGLEPKPNS